MIDSPTKNSDGVVRVSVFSEGKPINTSLFALVSLLVCKEVNRIGRATLVFDAGNMPKGEIPESDDDSFAPGKKIRIEAGYGHDENPIFEGIVVNHQLTISSGNESSLQIECCDFVFPATEVRKNKIFEKKKDCDAIKEIIESYPGLSASVDTTTTKYTDLVQYYCTDWDFILSRADANGLIVTTEGSKVSVKKPDVIAAPKLKVTYGLGMISFRGELSAEAQYKGLKATAWNPSEQKIIEVSGTAPSLNKQGKDSVSDLAKAMGNNQSLCQTEAFEDRSSLQAWADAHLLRAGLSRIQGDCKFPGSHKLLPGDLLELDGLGKRFNGNAFVGRIVHEIKNGDWITTAGLGLSDSILAEKPDVVSPAASGLLPGIQGLHIGKVVKLDGDPTNEYKVQVEIPILSGEVSTVWARLGNFWASNSYGSFFIPDVGDEVILGFFNEDPCFAVVLGSLYSSKQPPPYEITKENNIRSIFTKSKMKIEFHEEDKVITIDTPGKNKIQISDKDKSIVLEDQHKNKIAMDQNGILIDSAKEISLKAKTNIILDAGAGIKQTAKANIEMKGVNIEASANATLTVKGNAKAEISASGQTVVKGAMVMIN